MITSLMRGRRKWYLAGGGVLLIGAAALGLTGQLGRWRDPTGLPPELSAASLQARAENPRAMMETMHETMQRTDLTDAQREEVMHRMREVWQKRLDSRIDEYVAATDDQKQAILDRRIDEMQNEMQEREAQHERMERPQGPPQGRHRPDFASMTPQQRKSRAESRDPDRMARNMAYFAALRARAQERGIQLHGPGGRGFGGPGGPGGHGGPRP